MKLVSRLGASAAVVGGGAGCWASRTGNENIWATKNGTAHASSFIGFLCYSLNPSTIAEGNGRGGQPTWTVALLPPHKMLRDDSGQHNRAYQREYPDANAQMNSP